MELPNIPKYELEKIMAEAFYGYYPHCRKINNALWKFFETQERPYLWLSDIKEIGIKLKVDIAKLLIYLQLLTNEHSENPPLLRQNFYQLNKEGELELIRLSIKKVLREFKANSTKEPEEAFIDWAKSVFTYWEPINDEQPPVPLLDASFNLPSNSLWTLLQNQ